MRHNLIKYTPLFRAEIVTKISNSMSFWTFTFHQSKRRSRDMIVKLPKIRKFPSACKKNDFNL